MNNVIVTCNEPHDIEPGVCCFCERDKERFVHKTQEESLRSEMRLLTERLATIRAETIEECATFCQEQGLPVMASDLRNRALANESEAAQVKPTQDQDSMAESPPAVALGICPGCGEVNNHDMYVCVQHHIEDARGMVHLNDESKAREEAEGMNETLKQQVLRIAWEVKGGHGDLNIQIVEFARRLLAEQGKSVFPHCETCGSSAWFCTVCANAAMKDPK